MKKIITEPLILALAVAILAGIGSCGDDSDLLDLKQRVAKMKGMRDAIRKKHQPILPPFPKEYISHVVCKSYCKELAIRETNVDPGCAAPGYKCNCKDIQRNITEYLAKATFKAIDPPTLKCLDTNMVSVTWHGQFGVSYFLDVSETDDNEERQLTEMTNCEHLTVHELKPDTNYTIRLWGTDLGNNLIYRSFELYVTTDDHDSVPLPVENVTLDKLFHKGDLFLFDAQVSWTPADDLSCTYEVEWFKDVDAWEVGVKDPAFKERKIVVQYHEGGVEPQVFVEDLMMDSPYTVTVVAKSQIPWMQSEKAYLNFTTPSCLDAHDSIHNCTPAPVENFTVVATAVDLFPRLPIYNLEFHWNEPKHRPHFYVIYFAAMKPATLRKSWKYLNVSGDATTAKMENVIVGDQYQCVINAYSAIGPSPTVDIIVQNARSEQIDFLTKIVKTRWETKDVIGLSLGVAVLVLFAVSLVIAGYILCKRSQRRRNIEESRVLIMNESSGSERGQFNDSFVVEADVELQDLLPRQPARTPEKPHQPGSAAKASPQSGPSPKGSPQPGPSSRGSPQPGPSSRGSPQPGPSPKGLPQPGPAQETSPRKQTQVKFKELA